LRAHGKLSVKKKELFFFGKKEPKNFCSFGYVGYGDTVLWVACLGNLEAA
jgi:hypothetical protein